MNQGANARSRDRLSGKKGSRKTRDTGFFFITSLVMDACAPARANAVFIWSNREARGAMTENLLEIEASTDLGSWTNLAKRLSAPTTFEFLDAEAIDPSRFYRVRLEP